jgi:hypothetical protein
MVKNKARHVFVAGDIARIVLDRSIVWHRSRRQARAARGLGVYHAPRRDRRLPYLIDNIRGTLVRKAAGNMRGTAALNHAAALRPGVDD